MGEGLLPIPEYLAKKILQLELVKMQELMPETWVRDKEESMRNTLSLLWRRTAPVTDILQWLQCFGVLSQKYSQMVLELMAYQATIVKYSHNFEHLAWALYDLAYRRQVAQTKDLCWSCLNQHYSVCALRAKLGTILVVHTITTLRIIV